MTKCKKRSLEKALLIKERIYLSYKENHDLWKSVFAEAVIDQRLELNNDCVENISLIVTSN